MSVYTITPVWGNTWIGATENYITPNATASSLKDLIQKLALNRMACLPTTAYVIGWRMALLNGGRRSQLMRGPQAIFPPDGSVISLPMQGALPVTTGSGWPPLMQISLQVNVGFDNNRIARKFFAGVPQNVVQGQPATFNANGNPSWAAATGVFFNFLRSAGFQIQAQNFEATPLFNVIGVISATPAPGNLGIVIATTGAPGIARGDTIYLQHFLPAKGERGATLNGHWVVDSVDTTQATTQTVVYLRNSSTIDPTQQRFTPKTILFKKNLTTYPMQSVWATQIVTHKRGKAGGSARGRRLTRPSLDP